MDFEWDDTKAEANSINHGVTFDEAKTVFRDRLAVDLYDGQHSDDEERFAILGLSDQQRLLSVFYTERDGKTRLISARLMTRKERRQYAEGTDENEN